MIMLNIGDHVQHIETGNIGRIVGYGYQKTNDSYYLTTIKVELQLNCKFPDDPTVNNHFYLTACFCLTIILRGLSITDISKG